MNVIIYLKNNTVIKLTDVIRYMYLNNPDMYCLMGEKTEIRIAVESILMIVTEKENKKELLQSI
mgnify:CR=1 FL=1